MVINEFRDFLKGQGITKKGVTSRIGNYGGQRESCMLIWTTLYVRMNTCIMLCWK